MSIIPSFFLNLAFLYGSTCIGAKEIVPMFPAYYIFNSLLLLLLLLHIIWTYFILKVLYRAILSGQVYLINSIDLFYTEI
jgi:ceramide synthetase